jgi:hypothetical protein
LVQGGVSSTNTSFFSSVVERGIAAMQVILRSLFRSREGAVLLPFLHLPVDPSTHLFNRVSRRGFANAQCCGEGHDVKVRFHSTMYRYKFFSIVKGQSLFDHHQVRPLRILRGVW